MKKLVLALVAVAAISFVSCGGNNAAQPAPAADADSIAAVDDSIATDSIEADSVEAEVAPEAE